MSCCCGGAAATELLWSRPLDWIGRGCETAFSEALELGLGAFAGCDVHTVCAEAVEAAAVDVVDMEATDFGRGCVCERKAARKLLRNGLCVGIVEVLFAGPAGRSGEPRGLPTAAVLLWSCK